MLSVNSIGQKAIPSPQTNNIQDQYLVVGGYNNLVFKVVEDGDLLIFPFHNLDLFEKSLSRDVEMVAQRTSRLFPTVKQT